MRPCTASTALPRAALRSLLPRQEETCLRRTAASRALSTSRTPNQTPPRATAAPQARLRHASSSSSSYSSSSSSPTLFLRPSTAARPYHSYSHPAPPGPFNTTERALLSSAYAHVPAHGFTPEALALGARDAGYLDISTNLLPNGVFDLIRYHLVTRREALVQKAKELDASGSSSMRTGDKVFELTWERLLGNRDVVGRWQEVMFFFFFTTQLKTGLLSCGKKETLLTGLKNINRHWR
jgi:ubiquinone biosynthesis protein COQ9